MGTIFESQFISVIGVLPGNLKLGDVALFFKKLILSNPIINEIIRNH